MIFLFSPLTKRGILKGTSNTPINLSSTYTQASEIFCVSTPSVFPGTFVTRSHSFTFNHTASGLFLTHDVRIAKLPKKIKNVFILILLFRKSLLLICLKQAKPTTLVYLQFVVPLPTPISHLQWKRSVLYHLQLRLRK